MASLVQSGKYGVINIEETKKHGFYLIQIISEAYRLQNITQIYVQFISVGELVVKAQYLYSMQENSNLYWKQQSAKHNILVPTRKILHSRLDVVRIKDVQDTPNTVCNKEILFV